jgi:hypothetical protein
MALQALCTWIEIEKSYQCFNFIAEFVCPKPWWWSSVTRESSSHLNLKPFKNLAIFAAKVCWSMRLPLQ